MREQTKRFFEKKLCDFGLVGVKVINEWPEQNLCDLIITFYDNCLPYHGKYGIKALITILNSDDMHIQAETAITPTNRKIEYLVAHVYGAKL